jgi:hypothetical protein
VQQSTLASKDVRGNESQRAGGSSKVPQTLEEARAEADRLERLYSGQPQPEWVRMFLAITRGSKMGGGDGWFGPAQTRYTWSLLAARLGSTRSSITRSSFPGPDSWFNVLDRNKDGHITEDDLDWSENHPSVRHHYLLNRLFRQLAPRGDGRVTREDLLAFFDKAAGGKDHLTADDLREALLGGFSGGFYPGDAPTPEMLIHGLFSGSLGSLNDGPAVGADAPDFELKTLDGEKVRLSTVLGPKPVVLVFGNYTCPPFRSLCPPIDEVQRRYSDESTFLMIYVREAHPTDGWYLKSNDRVGVSVSQPKTKEQRCNVAGQFHRLVKPAMPLLIDEINDPVGHAWSGMPARLYVIDPKGKVAYKSGRGPFGFKVGEMEQALVMCLLEQPADSKPISQE